MAKRRGSAKLEVRRGIIPVGSNSNLPTQSQSLNSFNVRTLNLNQSSLGGAAVSQQVLTENEWLSLQSHPDFISSSAVGVEDLNISYFEAQVQQSGFSPYINMSS